MRLGGPCWSVADGDFSLKSAAGNSRTDIAADKDKDDDDGGDVQ